MSIILFLIFGLAIGLLARFLVPGKQSLGIALTMLLGVAGSFLGGFAGNAIMGEPLLRLHAAGFIGSLLGAVVLLVGYILVTRGSSGSQRAFK